MDKLFLWISISALALIAVVYFLTKESRLIAHEMVKAQKLPWTRVPQTTLSLGAALVLLGIIFETENRIINYIFIGIGVLISVIELIKSRTNNKNAADK